jgi:hypothetical protein
MLAFFAVLDVLPRLGAGKSGSFLLIKEKLVIMSLFDKIE